MQYFAFYQAGAGFQLLKELFATKNLNITPIAAWAFLPEVFLYTNFPLTNLDSVKGKKLRLLGDEAVIFGKLGISAVSTPSPEIYQAVQRGVIDGFQHSNLVTDEAMGFHEVVKYAYMGPTRQPTDMYIHYVNNDAWAKLPDGLKQMLIDASWAEGINMHSFQLVKALTVAEKWVKAGVKVEPVPKFFEDAVIKSALEFYAEQKAKDPLWAKFYDALMNFATAVNQSFPRL